ncbi:hypothetical protein JOB18_021515 [Solea senegalensis]|uniref:Uncharacterized protein n=1 Tax=Solea senegalensis TaxID=28829 RepID=A0AAV6QBR5_SOLSE|nr:hypothetical protein JOB18_021515 [Solea senegalensis]
MDAEDGSQHILNRKTPIRIRFIVRYSFTGTLNTDVAENILLAPTPEEKKHNSTEYLM